MTKQNKSKYDKIKKKSIYDKTKTENVKKFKNSKCEEEKIKNSKCDKT